MDMSNCDNVGSAEPHGVSKITISAQNGSSVSAPVILNSTVTGNISISNNYFPEPAAEVTDTSTLITDYKKSLQSEYAYITEYTSRAGEEVLLSDRYIDPLIVQKHREKKERENEMRSRGERFFNTRETYQRNQNISLDQLFGRENGSKRVTPRAVILQGDSGSGKSITAQKIVLDWASGELYSGLFDVVFHLRCKQLSGISANMMSLLDLLDCSLTSNEIAQILKDKADRVLFIIDGFDELLLSASNEPLPPKPNIKSHPLTIVHSLLKGRMMRDSFLLVTTRSTAVDKLEIILKKPQCFMEILGFSEKGVCEYFRKFFEDEEFSNQVYDQVKMHDMLFTACFIPVICWIICTIFKRKGKDGVVTSELTTTTSIFVDFVLTLLKHHSDLSQEEELDLIKNLGQLAESATPKRQILFSRNDLPKAISHLPNIPFLCTFRHQERTNLKEMFGFMHLSFQEFFSALFYMLTDKEEAKIKVKELLESAGNGRHSEHLLPVIRFLFGLSNRKVSRLIHHPKSTSTTIRATLTKWISKVLVKNIMDTRYMSDFILHCLYELHDSDTLKEVMKLWERSGIDIHWSLRAIDCQVVMYCLQDTSRIVSMEVKCKAKDLKVLHPALYKCANLWLRVDSMSDSDVDFLTSALRKKKDVGYLTMEDGDLSDESMLKILKTLSGQTSVGNIRLALRSISENNVDLTMNFLIKEMMGRSFSVCIGSQAENTDMSLCSEFTIAHSNKSFWFTVGHSEGHPSEKHGCYQGFSKISFAVCPLSEIPMNDFLKTSNNLSCFSDVNNTEFGLNVDSLVSWLSCVPGLTEIDMHSEYLTDMWASRILSFLQVNPKISHIKFFVSNLIIRDEGRVCSTFSVFRKPFVLYKMHDSEMKNPSLTLAMDRWAYDYASAGSGEDKAALVKLMLSFPPLKGSAVDWEDLFKRIYQIIQSTEKCPEFDEYTDSLLMFLHSIPGLKEVKVWLNNLIESWAAGLFSLFLSCSSLLHVQLKTSMSLANDVESLGLLREDDEVRLSVGCNHLNYIDNYDIDLFKPPEHKVLPCVTLTVTDEPENANADWNRFFQAYNQLKDLTECSPEYDQSMSDLLSILHSVSGLKKVDLNCRFMTVNGASRVLDLIQMNPSLNTLSFLTSELPESNKVNIKMDYRNKFYSINKTSEEDSDSEGSNKIRFSSARQISDDSDEDSMSSSLSDCSDEINDSDELDSVEQIHGLEIRMRKTVSGQSSVFLKCSGSSPGTQSLLSRIELTLSENMGKANSDWETFLQAYNKCKGISASSPALNESVGALLASLDSVSGLKELQLTIGILSETWPPKIFSLCHTCSSLHHICLQVEHDKKYSLLNACSSLSITRNTTDSVWTVAINLPRDAMIEISPSFISFTFPCSEISKLDAQYLFETLGFLKGFDESYEEHEELVGNLISAVLFVPGLQRVEFKISNLTDSWVSRILSLLEVCPGLQVIRFDCIESNGILLEDVVRILQSSQMNSICRIIITGMKCSKASSDGKVNVTFCRDPLSKLLTIHNIKPQDKHGDDDDFEELEDEDFIVL
ncbi:uncharacterized protein LOC130247973 [Danio aesculapii]|uniref:uncharacterized protein LOC130247973 n=1 Tax=Danio aesculapii TaxID=1142201 RepID=UPI0024BF4C04|nr:uncharacterized protein LOC130247973 [Danio aesculapii]